jgi:hypothetical protein
MTVRTLSELQDALDANLAWRRTEMMALAGEISRSESLSPGSPLARALARSGVALLYAHWEGFTKEACQHYVDYVVKRRLKVSELSDGLALQAMVDLVRRLSAGDLQAREHLLDTIRRPDAARARIPRKTAVDAKSNLRFNVLVEILTLVGVDEEQLATKRHLIDTSLCDARKRNCPWSRPLPRCCKIRLPPAGDYRDA